jgi:hypothetical protein
VTRPVNLAPLVSKEIQLPGTFRFNTEIDTAITLLDQNPQIEQVITHVLPIEDVNEAFAIAANADTGGRAVREMTLLDRTGYPLALAALPGRPHVGRSQFVVYSATVRALTRLSGARTSSVAAVGSHSRVQPLGSLGNTGSILVGTSTSQDRGTADSAGPPPRW